jgi:hypothetical protein
MKTLRYSVDRIENGTAILIPDGSKTKLELDISVYNFEPNMILDITFDGDEIKEIKNLPEKAEERLMSNKSRLHSLFSKNKK